MRLSSFPYFLCLLMIFLCFLSQTAAAVEERNSPAIENSSSSPSFSAVEILKSFQTWSMEHEKFYQPAEIKRKFLNWARNFLHVARLSRELSRSADGPRENLVELALYGDGDLSQEEFRARWFGSLFEDFPLPAFSSFPLSEDSLVNSSDSTESAELNSATPSFSSIDLGPTVDWRSQLSPAQQQGECGACAIFATVATLEASLAIKHGRRLKLSEQYLLDCLNGVRFTMNRQTQVSLGCGGTFLSVVWAFLLGRLGEETRESFQIAHNIDPPEIPEALQGGSSIKPGLPLSKRLPYHEKVSGKCVHWPVSTEIVEFSRRSIGFVHLATPNLRVKNLPLVRINLKHVLEFSTTDIARMITHLRRGPFAVAIAGADGDLRHYRGGIVQDDSLCPHWKTSRSVHFLTLVGYERKIFNGHSTPVNYWILRNSWGKSHGENGHFYFAVGKNICGLERGNFGYQPILGE